MKQYKVLASSITTHLNVPLSKDDVVNEERFHADHIKDLIYQKAIEEYTPEAKTPKTKKPTV